MGLPFPPPIYSLQPKACACRRHRFFKHATPQLPLEPAAFPENSFLAILSTPLRLPQRRQ